MQIATYAELDRCNKIKLCLHTLRADCNAMSAMLSPKKTFASTRSVQIATKPARSGGIGSSFASTRSVQIATDVRFRISTKGGRFASTRSVQIATKR